MPVTNYIWDVENDTCLMETDENGETKVVYSHEPTQFGGLISQRRDGQTYYHHYDALGSTRQLTDADENVTDEYVYTAWGEPVVASGTTENPYRWIGRWGYYWDEATGTNYVRRRDCQPVIARWMSVDPLGFLDALNLYWYSANNPIAAVDPAGELALPFVPGLKPALRFFQYWTSGRPDEESTNVGQGALMPLFSTNIVAKSFINGIPDVGHINELRPGGPPQFFDQPGLFMSSSMLARRLP